MSEMGDNSEKQFEMNNNFIEEDRFNEDMNEAEFCENIAGYLEPYNSSNNLPFPLYLKNHMPIIHEALVELERLRPKDPIEFFCAFILQKGNYKL